MRVKTIRGFVIATIAAGMFSSGSVQAQSLSFNGLTSDQATNVIKDLGSNFMHTSVMGASSLGTVFGFQLGFVGGQTNTPELGNVVKSADPSAEASKLMHASILGVISVPFGLTVEFSYLPSLGGEGFKFNNTGFALKWTMTDSVLSLPFDLALKYHYMKTGIAMSQTSPVAASIDINTTTSGFQLIAGKKFAIVEPYIGFGTASTDGTFSSSVASVFSPAATSFSANPSGFQWMAGVDLNLILVKLGLETSNYQGNQRISARLGFGF